MNMRTWSVHGLALAHVALDGMVTLKVFVPLWIVVVDAGSSAGTPNLSASTGWVGDHTGLSMNAGVHCFAVPAAPRVGGSGKVEAVCVELAPCLSEMRYHPGCATVACTVTATVCPACTLFTTFDAIVPAV